MTLTPTGDLIADAASRHVGIGAFNVLHLETAEGIVAAAERADLPVILQISENCVTYHGSLEPIALACLALARESSARVAVHLDHAEDERLALQAIDLGFGSVMFDASKLDYDANVAATRRVTEYAHRHGIVVEAELGEIGGKDGAHAPGVRTDPDEAVAFVAATGVDALAVAVGSSHAMTTREASLDLDLISRLHSALTVPLVLHGSSGVADDVIAAAIRAGMTKINVSTHLNGFFTRAIRDYLEENPTVVDSRKYLSAGRAALSSEAERLLELFAHQSEGRSA
ncbi:class II fructose-bisphosphate aldolase [Humibacter ginsenosidimutans]|uniref:Class II fructose-bisphosphate aldolase n=1 Tax=Humibacter ginsenosidimutans TaxID=2599293 RepID=A0A5B8M227_9MICO|nr:class II fructose-bisphosphate aldolase [Humibacter ginsenosidimutans]QDZ14818.1 class II fructose-bisphosphate aldolase [Humibacter ginsenosidimutans]